MSLHAMPFLIYNLGGEMIYILEQRLDAQKIEIDKAKKGKSQRSWSSSFPFSPSNS